MEIKKLLKELDKIGLPKIKYAITSSGTLAIRGLREANDLDILVTDDLWEKYKKMYPPKNDIPYLTDIGNISILGPGSAFRDQGIATVEELIENAETINNYKFVKLEYIKEFKKKLGREKDLKDIELIDKFLESNFS